MRHPTSPDARSKTSIHSFQFYELCIQRPLADRHVDLDEKDVAASIVPEYAQAWDAAVERRVVRKIDRILMPFMWIGYGLVYYDKVTMSRLPLLFSHWKKI
jgi:hypothetical protein